MEDVLVALVLIAYIAFASACTVILYRLARE